MLLSSKANIANFTGNTVMAGATGGGILLWLGDNASGIGALCVILGLIGGAVFKLMSHYEVRRHHRAIEQKINEKD